MHSYLNIVMLLINYMHVKIANISDLKPGEGKTVSANGKELALFNVDGKFFCIDNECAHQGGPIGEGFLENHIVSCPWHGAQYDLKTGKVLTQFPPSHDLQVYNVEVRGQEIFVDI